eukprot:1174185-Prorocentrum_minimum.AAC.7
MAHLPLMEDPLLLLFSEEEEEGMHPPLSNGWSVGNPTLPELAIRYFRCYDGSPTYQAYRLPDFCLFQPDFFASRVDVSWSARLCLTAAGGGPCTPEAAYARHQHGVPHFLQRRGAGHECRRHRVQARDDPHPRGQVRENLFEAGSRGQNSSPRTEARGESSQAECNSKADHQKRCRFARDVP